MKTGQTFSSRIISPSRLDDDLMDLLRYDELDLVFLAFLETFESHFRVESVEFVAFRLFFPPLLPSSTLLSSQSSKQKSRGSFERIAPFVIEGVHLCRVTSSISRRNRRIALNVLSDIL